MFILLWIHQFESLKSHVLHFLKNKKDTHIQPHPVSFLWPQHPVHMRICMHEAHPNFLHCLQLDPNPLLLCTRSSVCMCWHVLSILSFSTLFLGGEHSHIKAKGQCMKSPTDTLYLLLRWGLSLNLGLTDSARLVGSVSATSTGVTTAHYHPSFLRKLRDPNSAPGDYRATTFLTEPAHLLLCLPWTLSASGRSAEIKTMAHWPSDVLQESFWKFGGNIIKVFSWKKKMANILIHWLS